MNIHYESFVIQVHDLANGFYPVTARSQGASWSGQIPGELPLLDRRSLEQGEQWLERAFIDRDYVKDLGSRLFHTLLPEPILQGFRAAAALVGQKSGLRVVLDLPDALAGLPWELLYDTEGGHGFLARSTTAPLVRLLPGGTFPNALAQETPVRILLVVASPSDAPPVGVQDEITAIQGSLSKGDLSLSDTMSLLRQHAAHSRSLRGLGRRLRSRSLIEMDVLVNASRQSLQAKIIAAQGQGRSYHIVHFAGHGFVDDDMGHLLLEKTDGMADIVSAEQFAELIYQPTLSLVVLNACQSATPVSLFQGVAQALLQRGVPAVVGMQVPVLDRAALEFSREFYAAWAAGEPIEAALAYARRLMAAEMAGTAADWGVPVLYARTSAGLDLPIKSPPFRWPQPIRRVYRASAWVIGALSVIGVLFGSYQIAQEVMKNVVPAGPVRMDDNLFNVAVADFSIANGVAGPEAVDAVNLLTNGVLSQEQKIKKDATEFTVGFRHEAIGFERIDDARARQKRMVELARDLNADVLIHGHLDLSTRPARFVPEFYISPRLAGGEESTGDNVFGKSITVTLPLTKTDNKVKLVDDFVPRLEALSQFMLGLAFFKAADYDSALAQWDKVLQVHGWQETEGQEILYLWIGTTHLARGRQAIDDCRVPGSAAPDDFVCTQQAYEKAIALKSDFARAYIGMGNYWLTQVVQRRGGTQRINCQAYEKAIREYSHALELAPEAETLSFAELKANSNIGTAYAAGYRNPACGGSPAFHDGAVQYFTTTDKLYREIDANLVPSVDDVAARSNYQLGLVHRQAGAYDEAIAAFRRTIRIADPEAEFPDKWQAVGWKAYNQLGHVYAAQARWQEAEDSFNAVLKRYRANRYGGDDDNQLVVVSDAFYGLARVYSQQGRLSDAELLLDESIRVVQDEVGSVTREQLPDLPWISYLELGRVLLQGEPTRWADALAAFEAVIAAQERISPQLAGQAFCGAAEAAQALGDAMQAQQFLEQGQALGAC